LNPRIGSGVISENDSGSMVIVSILAAEHSQLIEQK